MIIAIFTYCQSHDNHLIISFFSLDALDPNAYSAFQVSHDLKDVVDRVLSRGQGEGGGAKPGLSKSLSIRISLMTPVKPMLVGVVCNLNSCMS